MGNIKIKLILNLIIFLFLLFAVSAFAQSNRGMKLHSDRYALVIGNSAYQTAPLTNPGNDAEDMSSTLINMGFTVILKKNADQRTMEDAIRSFGKQLRKGGVGLFYFAGHGMQVDGRNYLIPVDSKIESESDVKYEAVDAGRVLGKMEDAENQLNIVILDACRNNPFSRNFRSTETGLARMDAPRGSLIAYATAPGEIAADATAPGEIAADGTERNGIFTKYLMKHMVVPNLPIELVLKQTRIDVARATDGRQTPWESSSLMGNFYFKSEKGIVNSEKADKSNITSEKSPSETKMATIVEDSKRNTEPWTGIWNFKFYFGDGYKFVLKQNGKTVKSTNDSNFYFSGTIEGNILEGWIEFDEGQRDFCSLKISSDNNSFTGSLKNANWKSWNSHVFGKRRN